MERQPVPARAPGNQAAKRTAAASANASDLLMAELADRRARLRELLELVRDEAAREAETAPRRLCRRPRTRCR